MVADQHIRQQVLDVNQSFIVQAPAGSGKTELLSNRFLHLLTAVKQPEEILAITFTRKAAAEMRHRILAFIAMGKQEQPPVESHLNETWQTAQQVILRDAELDWNLLDNPNRLRVLTIDALCSSLAQRLPLLSRFGAVPEVSENADDLYQNAVEMLLQDLERDVPWSEELKNVLVFLDNDWSKFQRLMQTMLQKRSQWLPKVWQLEHSEQVKVQFEQALTMIVNDTLSGVVEALPQDMLHELIPAIEQAICVKAKSDKPFELTEKDLPVQLNGNAETLPYWRVLTQILLTQDKKAKFRASVNKTSGFPTKKDAEDSEQAMLFEHHKALLKQILQDLKPKQHIAEQLKQVSLLPEPYYNPEQWLLIQSLLQILKIAVGYLKIVFSDERKCDFNEISDSAIAALGGTGEQATPSDLLLLMDYSVNHLLVDEYQDTNEQQNQLLECLMSGWQPSEQRSLFLVGDPMQSIYRFRDAEVGLFLHVSQHGIGPINPEYRQLSVNFRSSSSVVEWNNRVFTEVFPEHNDARIGAVQYHSAIAFHQDQPLSGVSSYLFEGHNANSIRIAEANKVAEIVKERLQQTTGKVAILVKSRSHLKQIVESLKQNHIKYQAVDIDPLSERMLVQDLFNFIQVIFKPTDEIAWFACLRAPWCGISLQDCLLIREYVDKNQMTLYQLLSEPEYLESFVDSQLKRGLSQHAQVRLPTVVSSFRAMRHQLGRKSLRLLVETHFRALGGFSYADEVSELEDAFHVLKLLESLEQGGLLSDINEFKQQVEKLYAAADPSADGRVQLMTIHKSKGLQFETVIVPGLDHYTQGLDQQLMRWDSILDHNGEPNLIIGSIGYNQSKDDPIYHFLSEFEKKRLDNEMDRLLYVALTRAETSLILLGGLHWDDKKQVYKKPDERSMLARLWPHIESEASRLSCAPQQAYDNPPPRMMKRLVPEFELVAASIQLPEAAAENEPVFSLERYVGTLMHLEMQNLVEQAPKYQEKCRHPDYQGYIQARLLELAGYVDTATLQLCGENIQQALSKCLQNDTARWILDPSHQFSRCEYALIDKSHPYQSKKVIDRCFVDQDILWVIDYKSSQPADKKSENQFYQLEWEQYWPQLRGYQKLLSQYGNIAQKYSQIKLALFFPMTQKLITAEDYVMLSRSVTNS